MVGLSVLWFPIVLSAVLVFAAGWILHMLLPVHRNDYQRLPREDELMEAMRRAGVGPGNYAVPCPASPAAMSSPEMLEKYERGPVGLFNVIPSGPPAMGKYLAQWFAFCVVVGVFVAYVAGRTLAAGTEYLQVFRVAGTVAFVAYGMGDPMASIWKGQKWSTTLKHVMDALVYALLTAGTFGWLWPD